MGPRVWMVAVAILASVVACKEKPPECASVIAGLAGRLDKGSISDEVRSNLRAVLSNRCTEDKWSAAALTCMDAATTRDQLTTCGYQHLSQEQGDKLRRAMPSTPGGVNVDAKEAKPASNASAALAQMVELADRMCQCTSKSCADGVQDRMTRWSTEMAIQRGSVHDEVPDAATMRKMTEAGQRYAVCMTSAMTGDAHPMVEMPRAPAESTSELPRECLDYKAAITKLADCEKLPRVTRDALRESYDLTARAWADVPDESRATLARACKAAAEAVTMSAAICE